MKLNAMTKKVQNINITDLTAIYSNFEASMATQCILDQLRDHERCEYDYVASTITLTIPSVFESVQLRLRVQNEYNLPGHPPELSDSVKLLLTDAKRHGFEIDQILKSID